ncbi:phage tail protein [Ralstonia nicotianae]|nr:tail assembly protein [Ralstonia solanacearum]
MTDTVFHFHPTTGEYTGSSLAEHSPLEPGVVLIPAHATTQAPPETGAREVAVFRDDAWHIASDWRGAALFAIVDGAAITITELGTTPADVNATETARPSAAHVWNAGTWVEDARLKSSLLATLKLRLCDQLDAAADAVRLATVGDPLRAVEYQRAADEALAYRTAGYSGDVPPSVQSAADAKGVNAWQAADDILKMHAAWDTVLYDIRALRLTGKESVRAAASEKAAMQAAEEAIAALRSRADGGGARYE